MALEKHFEHTVRESALAELWEKNRVSKPESSANQKGEVVTMTLPPPNANGELHVGHMYGYTVMDAIGRFHRMRGKRVLLVPGKDHAGIQTQVVFEKRLRAEGREPNALPRDQVYKECYDFCIDRSAYMRAQERSIGLTADYDREFFTLDPRLTEIINDTFVSLWKDGLVYRGKRIINWSVLSQTGLSDVEVEYREEQGALWFLRYSWAEEISAPSHERVEVPSSHVAFAGKGDEKVLLVEGDGSRFVQGAAFDDEESQSWVVFATHQALVEGVEEALAKEGLTLSEDAREWVRAKANCPIVIVRSVPQIDLTRGLETATTRPETLLGDTAMAVHPSDPRYRGLVGKTVQVPFQNRAIPVIADYRVDMSFGTGVIKVTPAHDFLDYDIGMDHKLPMIQVIGPDGMMTAAACAEYMGLTVKECRAKIVKDLEEKGALLATREMVHKVPISERGKDVIEPLISEQWFVAVDKEGKSIKKKALELVRSGQLKVYPENFRGLIEQWLENLRDWNISRQIWWGHRVPVWYRTVKGEREIHVGSTPPEGDGWEPESDTFDTWFSSGQWAYSTIAASGLYDLTQGAKGNDFFPTHTMVMGRDILFFWACRMLLLTTYRLGTVPFKNLFFHGLIRDEHNRKFSKSAGNGFEPKEMQALVGTDALRLSYLMGTSAGNDVVFSKKKIEGYSRFTNKLWNAAKLVEIKLGDRTQKEIAISSSSYKLESSRWILAELGRVHRDVTAKMERFEISPAAGVLYSFVWGTYCDWYLEMAKALIDKGTEEVQVEARAVLADTFSCVLTMLHPVVPFVTEEIFQSIPALRRDGSATLAGSSWGERHEEGVSLEVSRLIEAVTAVRSVKVGAGLATKRSAVVSPFNQNEMSLLLGELSRVEMVAPEAIPAAHVVRKAISFGSILCDVPDRVAYRKQVEKDIQSHRNAITVLEKKLQSGFVTQADPEVVAAERERLATTQQMLSHAEKDLADLGS